jgi:hypothetical protein
MASSAPRAPTGIILPGRCFLALNELGLPAVRTIRHSAVQICCCGNREDEIFVKYLIVWQAKFSEEMRIDKKTATAMVCRLINQWQLQVPVWLQPIVQEWAQLLQSQPET